MTEENPLTIAELGAYTNNSMNREGIKHLVDTVNGLGEPPSYTAGRGIVISDDDVISLDDGWITATKEDLITHSSDSEFMIKGKIENADVIFFYPSYETIDSFSNITNKHLRLIPIKTTQYQFYESWLSVTGANNNIAAYLQRATSIRELFTSLTSFTKDNCYGFDGVKITDENIGDYVDINATPNKLVKKPFSVVFNDSYKSVFIGVVGSAKLYGFSINADSGVIGASMWVSNFYDAFNNNSTTVVGYQNKLDIASTVKEITNIEIYRRYKNPLPVPEVTP